MFFPSATTCACSSTDRASDYGSEGCEFESRRARHKKSLQTEAFFMVRCRFVAKRASDNAAIRGIQIKRREVVKPGGNTEPAVT